MTAREEHQTQSLELAREELAAVAIEHVPRQGGVACDCGWSAGLSLNDTRSDQRQHLAHVADTLLASPALARVIRGREEAAWDEGRRDTRAGWLDPTYYVFNPYRDLTGETL